MRNNSRARILRIALPLIVAGAALAYVYVSSGTNNGKAENDADIPAQSVAYLEAYSYYGFDITRPDPGHVPLVKDEVVLSGRMTRVPPQIGIGLRAIVTGFPDGVRHPETSRTEVVPLSVRTDGTFSFPLPLHFGAGAYRIRLEAPMDYSDPDDVQYKGVVEFWAVNRL